MAEVRLSEATRQAAPRDIGTLWTLVRGESSARCALLAMAAGLELRVVMDGSILRSEQCSRHDEAFELAERWRNRMMDRGWTRLNA